MYKRKTNNTKNDYNLLIIEASYVNLHIYFFPWQVN